ncbi:hypothetical protein Agub_g9822 [Astrephomene gubernaculifera]|uniref:Uncharacterized protein n=1 Tax=Astrephomene gubernaculifera TaxID=47775 RepID=A0AAD3DUB5_9CHLO|nr:hypothetical protein Agub_g9822 [Astrephomene gubernaculifera]
MLCNRILLHRNPHGAKPLIASRFTRTFFCSKVRSSRLTMGSHEGRVDPESIPSSKFGSGNPHTQSADDTQGIVTGCDELKAGEPAPGAVQELVQDVVQQDREEKQQQEQQGEKQQQEQQGRRLGMPPDGSAAATGGYGKEDCC